MKTFLLLFSLFPLLPLNMRAQERAIWLPENWTTPTVAPAPDANRVVLYSADSARVTLLAVLGILRQQGFSVEYPNAQALTAGRVLPDSLKCKGGAAVNVTVITAAAFPGILVLSSSVISNLRRLNRLSRPTASHPTARQIFCPGEAGANNGVAGSLPQIGFDALNAIVKVLPGARIRYSQAQSPH